MHGTATGHHEDVFDPVVGEKLCDEICDTQRSTGPQWVSSEERTCQRFSSISMRLASSCSIAV